MGREGWGWGNMALAQRYQGPRARRSFLRRGLWAYHSEGGLPNRAKQEWLFTVYKRVSEMKKWRPRTLGTWTVGQGMGWVTSTRRKCSGFWTSQAVEEAD